MAALPRSMIGIIGFILFVAFLVGSISTVNTQNDIEQLNNQLQTSINSTAASDNIFTGILNTGGTALAGIQMVIGYLKVFSGFEGISGLPTEFFVMFALVGIGLIIAIIRFIRGQLDQ